MLDMANTRWYVYSIQRVRGKLTYDYDTYL